MRRIAIPAAVAAALVAATVAVGASGDIRIHRLHLPPPPVADGGRGAEPPAPAAPTAPPVTTQPPPGTSPPAPPSPPSPPPASVGCSTGGAATPAATGTLEDYSLTLDSTTFSSGAPLTFRGMNSGADFHSIAIKTLGGANLCGTPTISAGTSSSFTVTNLPAGSYTIYCTIHPDLMHEDITVN